MKLKLRIKKALFAFFKDEIMRAMGYSTDDVRMKYIQVDHKVKCINASILLDDENERRMHAPMEYKYNEALDRCRHQLFEEVMKHVIVDNQSVLDPHVFGLREICVSLYITKPNQP